MAGVNDALLAMLRETMPRYLLAPEELEGVIAFLRGLPVGMGSKRYQLSRWALAMDLRLEGSHYARLAGGPGPV